MARYLMRDKLEELGLHHFDAWAKLFADTVVTLEQTVTGAYGPTARFSRFKKRARVAAIVPTPSRHPHGRGIT